MAATSTVGPAARRGALTLALSRCGRRGNRGAATWERLKPGGDAMPDAWDGRWSNAVFPLAERDRRWGAVRAAMAREGLFALVCFPSTINHDRGGASARW